jgi:hypothetical protein
MFFYDINMEWLKNPTARKYLLQKIMEEEEETPPPPHPPVTAATGKIMQHSNNSEMENSGKSLLDWSVMRES